MLHCHLRTFDCFFIFSKQWWGWPLLEEPTMLCCHLCTFDFLKFLKQQWGWLLLEEPTMLCRHLRTFYLFFIFETSSHLIVFYFWSNNKKDCFWKQQQRFFATTFSHLIVLFLKQWKGSSKLPPPPHIWLFFIFEAMTRRTASASTMMFLPPPHIWLFFYFWNLLTFDYFLFSKQQWGGLLPEAPQCFAATAHLIVFLIFETSSHLIVFYFKKWH